MNPPQRNRAPHRVLMTADTVGGVWTYAMELVRGLKRHGVEVVLFSMGRLPDHDQQREAAQQDNLVLIPTQYRLEWMDDCVSDLAASGDALLTLEQQYKPDLVHVNGYWHARLAYSAPVLVVAHSCVSSWWQACRGTPLPAQWTPYGRWIREALSAADMLIAPTAAFLRDFQSHHGFAQRARVIWNGRDGTPIPQITKKNLVLAAGRVWDEAKNIGVLCKAARDLDVPITVAGDTTAPDGSAAELNHVQMLGRLGPAQLARKMAQAAIFAAPARYEPFGLTILEAALSNCALVLGDIPSLRELWEGAAVFVHPDDEDQWRNVLAGLSRDPSSTAELGAKARERALLYSTQRMADAYRDAYGELLSSTVEAAA
jgi:glycogen synthase